MNRTLFGIGGLALALALLLAVNILAGATLRSTRVDLTENRLYTLSDGTKRILAELDEPITLRLYFSKDLAKDFAPLPDYAERIEELLLDFQARSDGAIRLEVVDPEPFSEVEDRAVAQGLRGVPLPGGTGDNLYFGLVGSNSVGDEEIVPFFHPEKEPFVEYELTRLVHRLANPDRPVVGVLSSLPLEGAMPDPMSGQMPQPWYVMDLLRQVFETRTILPSAEAIPDDVRVLLVVHPKALPERAVYAIDQFVLRGGRVIAFVDPFCEADQPPRDPSNPMAAMTANRSSSLPRLFEAWGVRMVAGQIAADQENALGVRWVDQGREQVVPYVVWLGLGPDELNSDEVMLDGIERIQLGTAGVLEPAEGATTTFVPLLQTSEQSMQLPVTSVQFAPDPKQLLADFFPTKRKLTIAARITGDVQSAFPDGPPPREGEEPEAEPPAHLAQSAEPIAVVVVADCDLLADQWWVRLQNFAGIRMDQKIAGNGDFVANAVDLLRGSTDLIGLRGRGGSARPFKVVEQLQREAEQALRAEEQRLVERLQQAERELNDLLSKGDGTAGVLFSPEAQAKIEALREQQVETRRRLREVRHDLRKDIERLGVRLKWLNIALIPALVGLFATGLGFYKKRARRP